MNKQVTYYIEPKSALIVISSCFLLIAVAVRGVWWIMFPWEMLGTRALTHGVLPILSCALLVVIMRYCGKGRFWATAVPVFMGVVFFSLKAAGFVWWHRALCTLLYFTVAALYGLTAFGVLPIRRLLIPLFGLPLLFHLFVEDMFIMRETYTVSGWMQEGSVICIMAALLCLALAIRVERETPPEVPAEEAEPEASDGDDEDEDYEEN